MPTLLRRHSITIMVCTLALLLGITLTVRAFGPSAEDPTRPGVPTPVGTYEVYIVQRGDTLGRLATRFGVRIRDIVQANRIVNPDLIITGEVLYIPLGAQPTREAGVRTPAAPESEVFGESTEPVSSAGTPTAVWTDPFSLTLAAPTGNITFEAQSAATLTPEFTFTPSQTYTPSPTFTPSATFTPTPPPEPMALGVEVFADVENAVQNAALLASMRSQWVRLRVDWSEIESVPGVLDYANLDAVIAAFEAQNQRILLTLASAPNWTRTSDEENGPPDDLSMFADFAGAIATHYAGRVAAYEIWNEPNLRREWNSAVHPIGASAYAQLLNGAYTAIKASDPAAAVISAGLAPTGIDDGFNAVNDRRFFTDLVALGVGNVSDGLGLHLYGFAIPPTFPCCDAPSGVTTHYGDISFYFGDRFALYRQIAASAISAPSFWVTAMGWGVAIPGVETPRNFVYVDANTPETQAQYTIDALDLLDTSGVVRAAIVSNLDGCITEPRVDEACYLGWFGPDSVPRPIYEALRTRP